MSFCDLANDREAESGTAGGPGLGCVGAPEALEDTELILRSDARPLVYHREGQPSPLIGPDHCDGRTLGGEADGIGDQVRSGPVKGLPVATDRQRAGGDIGDEGDPVLLGTCGAVGNTCDDMDVCYRDIDLGSFSAALNDPSPFTLLALLLAVAKRRGVPWDKITGRHWGYPHSQLHKHYSGDRKSVV